MKQRLQLLQKRTTGLGLSLLIVDGLFFGSTNPSRVQSPLLIVAILLLTCTLFYIVFAALKLAAKSGFEIGSHQKKAAYGGSGVAAILIAMQSVGQLTVHDVVVLMLFALLTYVYVTYTQTAQRQ